MKCPKCLDPLGVEHHAGVEYDRCPRCKGLWLDRGEAEKLLADGSPMEVDSLTYSHLSDMLDEQGGSCPRCQVEMRQKRWRNIKVDHCPKCLGIWLDEGELSSIALLLRGG